MLEVDRENDLALIQILTSGLTPLPLGDSKKVQLAEDVRVVGFPLSDVLGNSIKVNRGTVSGTVNREDGKEWIETDAPINPGNSGGPMVNMRGEVIGVANAKLAAFGVSDVGFAVPVEKVRALLKRQGVIDPVAGAAAPLAGPDLAKRVTPGVALVTVTVGPGGLGSDERYRLLFNGSCEKSMGKHGTATPGGAVTGKVVTDSLGEVYNASGFWLPMGLGPQCLVGIERLPDSPQATTWHVHFMTSLSEVASHAGVALPDLPRSSSGAPSRRVPGRLPFHGPPSRYGGGQPATVVIIPAAVSIEYRLGAKSAAGVVTIKKHYELKVAVPSGDPSPLTVSGDGTVLYDSHSHLVRSLQFKGKLVCDGKESSVVVPFTYAYAQVGAASSEPLASSAAPPAEKTSSASAAKAEPAAQAAAPAEPAAAETAEAAKPADRAPLPDQQSRDKAAALVEQVFSDQLKKARTSEEKLDLVERLLGAANGEKTPAGQFALLNGRGCWRSVPAIWRPRARSSTR